MVICSSCQHENPEGSRFCFECGGALASRCGPCQAELPPGVKFCNQCGAPATAQAPAAPERDPRAYTPQHLAERILQSKAALEGERKQVTVLFADVRGSTELSEQLDPEVWHGVLDGFFKVLTDGVHRFEGQINQYTGDGIMALFGAPIALEDHAQRACWAALHLAEELRRYGREVRRERGLTFSVRMGINSGEVVVGKIGDDLRMDYTAQGHVVNLAARMQELAEPGKALLTEHTAALVSGWFELEDQGQLQIRGIADPVHVSELQSVGQFRTRLDRSRARGLSRFVGRAREMEVLQGALADARAGQPRVVGLVANAGVGKSRLCYEFLESCRARGLMTYETQGVAHGKSMPFVPILRLFRDFFGIVDPDSDTTSREKIAGRLLLLDEQFRDLLPVVFDFLGVADPEEPTPTMDPDARRRQLLAVVRGVSQARAGRESTVLVLEDLHWFDPGSEAFVEALVDAPAGSTGLVVVNFRPEYESAWMRSATYEQVPLAPLGPEAVQELLADLLGDDPSHQGLPALIRERTGGNPFFVEEVVNSLVEAGTLQGSPGAYRLTEPVAELAIPDTVQSVLAARMDRLAEREKRVLQTAAVIGRQFREEILRRVAELPDTELRAALAALQAADFVNEESLYPEAIYLFKHPLTEQVALESQLAERRRALHRGVAQAIEEVDADRLDERAALLAHHWDEAGEALVAAAWHARAAEWAGVRAVDEAHRHWYRVRELCAENPDSGEAARLGALACRKLLGTGFYRGLTEDEATRLYTEGRSWVERLGDPETEALLLYSYSVNRGTGGHFEESLDLAFESERLAHAAGNEELAVLISGMAINDLFYLGRFDEGLERVERLLEVTAGDLSKGIDLWGSSSHLWGLWNRARVIGDSRNVAKAREDLADALQQSREAGDYENETWAAAMFVRLAWLSGDADEAINRIRRALDSAERGSPFCRFVTRGGLGAALLLTGQAAEAIEILREVDRASHDEGIALMDEAEVLANLSRAHLEQGDRTEALRCARSALTIAEQRNLWWHQGWAQLALAHALRSDAPDEAGVALDAADAAFERAESGNWCALVALERAELARDRGDEQARKTELTRARELFTGMGATTRAEELAVQLARS